MSEGLVLFRIEDEVAVITLNRPEKLNALSGEVWRELDAAMVRADDDPAVKVIVLCGYGRAFCAQIFPPHTWLHEAHGDHYPDSRRGKRPARNQTGAAQQ